MNTLLLLGLLTGLDNLQVTPALGLLNMSARRRFAWALAFGLAETLMPLLGLALGLSLHRSFADTAEFLGPVLLVLCGAAVVIMGLRRRDLSAVVASRWALVVLPLSLSFDNLFAGLGVGAGGASLLVSALVIGGISTAVGLVGLYAGHLVRRWIPERPELFSGGYLMLLGVGSLVWHSL